MSNTGVPFSLLSTSLAQQVVPDSTGTGRLASGRLWKDEIWNLCHEEGTVLWSLATQLMCKKHFSFVSCSQPCSVCRLFGASSTNAQLSLCTVGFLLCWFFLLLFFNCISAKDKFDVCLQCVLEHQAAISKPTVTKPMAIKLISTATISWDKALHYQGCDAIRTNQ